MSDRIPSSGPSADRNLLFGILALQMDFISRDALIAAMHAWVLDKAKPLGQILVEQGNLNPQHLALLEPLVQAHIEAHHNDPQQSLAAISSVSSVRDELESLLTVGATQQAHIDAVCGVTAYRESISARERRWMRRHRVLMTGLAAALLVGLVGLAVGLVFVTGLNRQLDSANAELAAANTNERKAREQAEKVLEFVENRVFAAARPYGLEGGLGHAVTLRRAVYAALPYVAKSFSDQPLIEARLRLTLGTSFGYLGDPKTAAEQFEAARALYAGHRGPDHLDTLRSMGNLANSYATLGRHADAVKLHEETLALMKTKLGPDHPHTLTSMNNLANSYAALGHHAEALKLYEETLKLGTAKLGPDHPLMLASISNQADSYAALGRHAEALKLHEETLALQKAKLGRDHPHTLLSMMKLANDYAVLGRYAEALKLHEETLALRKAKLGPDHPNTLISMMSVASDYAGLGRYAEALKLCEETQALQKAKLGPDHPDTLMSMYNLARSYATLGRYADALKLYEETLALYKAKLGPDQPVALRSMWGVAESLFKLERGAEAVPIIDECVQRAAGKVVDPRLLPAVMDLRLRHFEQTKDPVGCRQTAQMWEKLNRADADSLYNAACMRAVSAAVLTGAKQADAEAEQAMVWLKKAVAAGYKNAAHMEKDKDLDTLRDREDFKKLLAELTAGSAKQK
jgi:tetratricopeptide (TPR) repeat protein